MKKLWLILPLFIATAAYAAVKFSPTGKVANYRFTGYFEAILVIHRSELPESTKDEVIQLLANSPEMDQYFVKVEDGE